MEKLPNYVAHMKNLIAEWKRIGENKENKFNDNVDDIIQDTIWNGLYKMYTNKEIHDFRMFNNGNGNIVKIEFHPDCKWEFNDNICKQIEV